MARNTVYLETFGCQMNELDSELVVGSLRALGYRFVKEPMEAGVVLYNTCSVREHAEQKVWSRLGELALRKRAEPGLVVGVLGCMAEREGEALIGRMPVVDVLVGPGELDKLPRLLDNAVRTRSSLEQGAERESDGRSRLRSAGQMALQGNVNRRSSTLAAAADELELLDLSRSFSAQDAEERGRSAYVRITRGCNKFCSYCVVPSTRGAEVHRPPETIVEECRRLADAGVIEITLLGQTVNHYRFEHGAAVSVGGIVQPQKGRAYVIRDGVYEDPYRGAGAGGQKVTTFADLLAMIHEAVPSVARLRFVTSFPRSFGDDVLRVIRDHPRICRYLHVPAQSGSNRMLRLMNRGYTVEEYLEFLERARAHLHEPAIGRPLTVAGDIIVGFPTETEEDFAATRVLLEKARYKNCFIFKYSERPGTIASEKMADDVPEAVKRRRNAELLALQGRISEEVGREFVGMELAVMVEGVSKRERRRAEREAPGGTSAGIALTVSGKPVGGEAGAPACVMDSSADESHIAAFEDEAEASGGGVVQMSARTEGDLIVFFDEPAARARAMAGRIVRVRVRGHGPLSLTGERVGDARGD
ncbi:MAG: MiaB/RimO family radical SAM methylthiotransferase [Phycisphaerales bacterium]